MRTKQAHAQPARLEEVRRRFERWRRTRKALSRIPDPLWAAAVEVAGVAGISRAAKTLRVNHHALKKRIAEAAAIPVHPGEGPGATFVELAPPTRTGSCQCTLELEDACGAKMRVHLQSAEAPDLAALSRSFWELRS
jgi:hypothetical protein